MIDVFRECRERVSAKDAAARYGIEINRQGKARCPFHNERTPSMGFKGGRYHCFGCGTGGDAVDLTARLFNLEPKGALSKLNRDFGLCLPLGRDPTPEERRADRRRRELDQAHREFEEWRKALISRLSRVYLLAHEALKTAAALDDLTSEQVLAVRWQSYVEYLVYILECGSINQQMEIFRQRGRIGDLCGRISSSTRRKSGAA